MLGMQADEAAHIVIGQLPDEFRGRIRDLLCGATDDAPALAAYPLPVLVDLWRAYPLGDAVAVPGAVVEHRTYAEVGAIERCGLSAVDAESIPVDPPRRVLRKQGSPRRVRRTLGLDPTSAESRTH